jgi:SAM-dependent methyltransferase
MGRRLRGRSLQASARSLGAVDPRARAAWRAKHAREAEPWRGPVHAAPLLAGLAGRVVELGAGGGKVARALPPGAVALDWAPEGLRDAARPRLVADARALPFRDGALDALVAIHLLGHLRADDRGRALAEWARALRPGGALVVEVFARGDAREGRGREAEPGTWERGGIATHHFDAGELRALLAAAGFEGQVEAEERPMRWGARRVLRGRLTRRPRAR